MEDDARRVSDELRHKHIRTLEVLRQLIDENNVMRKKLKEKSGKQRDPNDLSAGELVPHEEALPESNTRKELKDAIEASAKANLEVNRVTAELDQVQSEAKRARAAEEANELTLVVVTARNKELEEARDAAEKRCQEQVGRLEADIAELKEQLASTTAEARETEARAKLDVSRLESEVAELRHSANQAALNRVGTPWSDDGDGESVLSQREVENLQLCLRKAFRRASTADRRCGEFERQKLPPPAVPHRQGRLNGADITRKGRGGAPIALVKRNLEAASGPAMDPLAAVTALPGGNTSDDGSTASLAAPSNHSKKKTGTGDDEGELGSGIRRLRESERILRDNNAKLQRELKQSTKRLEKAESFASNLEAELQRVAGDGVSFETFVVLKRDNQALKTQLAEIKKCEMLRTAGLLAVFGVLNLVPGVYNIILATIDGQDWSGDSDTFPPVVLHLAALIQIVFSVVSIAVGFQYLVCGGVSGKWSMISFFCSLFSLFSFTVAIAYVSFLSAKDDYNFIHSDFNASTSENRSVASMIAIGYIAYAANNFLALVYLNYKLFMLQSKEWTGFNRAFYKCLLMTFGLFTLLAGVVQLALGAYVFDKVAEDRLSSPISTGFMSGPYVITYSRIAMAFGAFQVVLGCYILWRATQKPSDNSGENAGALKSFQLAAWFVLVFSISAQVLGQAGMTTSENVLPNAIAGFAAQAVTYVLGLGLFPMYLDGMYTTTPETIDPNDYDKSGSWVKEGYAGEERKTESAVVAQAAGSTA
eukprot:g6839.t1